MIGKAYLEKRAADAARRGAFFVLAILLLCIVALLLSGALAAALSDYFPIWAALLISAGALLLLASIALLITFHRSKPAPNKSKKRARTAESTDFNALLEDSIRNRPKTTLGLAVIAGVILGADPGLRRDLITLLKTQGQNDGCEE